MENQYLVAGDNGSLIQATIYRQHDNSLVDLSTANVRLYFKKRGGTSILSTLDSVALLTEAAQGIAVFNFDSDVLDVEEGWYVGEIEVTFADNDVETIFETIRIYVRADF